MMTVGLFILAVLGSIGFALLVLIAMIPAVHFLVELLYKYDDWLDARRDKRGHDHHDPH